MKASRCPPGVRACPGLRWAGIGIGSTPSPFSPQRRRPARVELPRVVLGMTRVNYPGSSVLSKTRVKKLHQKDLQRIVYKLDTGTPPKNLLKYDDNRYNENPDLTWRTLYYTNDSARNRRAGIA